MFPALLISLCVILRVIPHPPNFAPVGATAVFAGRTMKPWMAVVFVSLAMFAGDFALSRIQGFAVVTSVTPFVYAGFFAQAMLGRALRAKKGGALLASVGGSLAFFFLSNFGVWLGLGTYRHDLAGFSACYVAALPFFGRTLLGDLVWTVVLSAAYRPIAARLASHGSLIPVPPRDFAAI